MIIVGIDPGINGAVAVMTPSGTTTSPLPTHVLPNGTRELDTVSLRASLPAVVHLFVLEEVGGDPKFGGSRAFNFGKTFGQILGLVECTRIPFLRVRPQAWKKAVLGPGPSWSKDEAIAHVQDNFPGVNLTLPGKRKPSHDLAEAVCLARFGEKWVKENQK